MFIEYLQTFILSQKNMTPEPCDFLLYHFYLYKNTTYYYLYIQDKEKEIKAEFKQSDAEKRNEKKDSLSAPLFFSVKERTEDISLSLR